MSMAVLVGVIVATSYFLGAIADGHLAEFKGMVLAGALGSFVITIPVFLLSLF